MCLVRLFDRLFGRSRRLEAKIDRILTLQVNTMGQLEDLTTQIDAETNAVAAKIDHLNAELQAAVAAGQAPNPATLAQLAAVSARLKTIGADPAQPIPAPVVEPAAATP